MDIDRMMSEWRAACSAARRAGGTPPTFEEWLETQGVPA
jgi:hypothetical protein